MWSHKNLQGEKMKNIIILLFSLTVIACGGGGGGESTPSTDSNTKFSFKGIDDQSRVPNIGDTETWNLTGKVSTGESVSMTLTIKNSGTAIFNGNSVNVIDVLSNIKIPDLTIDMASIIKYYYDNNRAFVRSYDTDDGTTCLPVGNAVQPPSEVKVGDFGSAGSETCNDGSASSSTWKAEGVDNTHVNIIFNETERDNLGVISVTSTTILKINKSGVISDISFDGTYYTSGSKNFSISLKGRVP